VLTYSTLPAVPFIHHILYHLHLSIMFSHKSKRPNFLSASFNTRPPQLLEKKPNTRYTRPYVGTGNGGGGGGGGGGEDWDSDRLGVGAYGEVHKAYDTKDKIFVAEKRIKLSGAEEGIPATALREISNLKLLVHTNVVCLLDTVVEPGRLSLIFELMDGDLKKAMDACPGPFAPDLVRSYTSQLLSGLSFCHCMGVMHRDLKPQNLLVCNGGKTLKIADFGLSRAYTPPARPLTVEVITRWYRSPDLLLGSNTYSPAVDMWSVGCIIAEMSNRKPLLPGDSEIDQLHRIFKFIGTPTERVWKNCYSLPYWRTNFPAWPPKDWAETTPHLSEEGRNLLKVRHSLHSPCLRSFGFIINYLFACFLILCITAYICL
jgi:serine/threonine protein kinase